MIKLTVVGAGVYGTRIAEKYGKFSEVEIKAVVSPRKPSAGPLSEAPFFISAREWRGRLGAPSRDDVFDLCVHQGVLLQVFQECIQIGVKNFILPKPIAYTKEELETIQKLTSEHGLNVLVASQWHYSALLNEIKEFLKSNKRNIASVSITFSRTFDTARQGNYVAKNAFLPHMLQIANDLGMLGTSPKFQVEEYGDAKIKLTYQGRYPVTLETDLRSSERIEEVKIFLEGDQKPSVVANFTLLSGAKGTTYPSITAGTTTKEVREDVLEKMIKSHVQYFSNTPSATDLTLGRYLGVATEEVNIVSQNEQTVGVIGGGIFGVLSALHIAHKGYKVVLLERSSEIITGASLVNQCRIHMGYHYPRDERTVRDSLEAKGPFEQFLGESVVRRIDNYYLVAKEGSMTSKEAFLQFCQRMHLPHTEEYPKDFVFHKGKIALSVKVPEAIFDANRERAFLMDKIKFTPNITLITEAEVVAARTVGSEYDVVYKKEGREHIVHCSALINASYSGANGINDMLGLPLDDFQYELCEVPVVKTPWKGSGWSIIDGPFFGVMPFGYSEHYLFYDVALSVLERSVGKFPEFTHDKHFYDEKKRRAERFKKYKDKWGEWIEGLDKCEHVSSMYVTRMVLPHRDKTDTRPTIVNELMPGFWQIFSGKIGTSISNTTELSAQVDAFLTAKRKRL